MSKLNTFLWAGNIEILTGLLNQSGKSQTIEGPKGSIPGMVRKPDDNEMKNYFEKAGASGYNIETTHWCGIFQTYLLTQAGVACHWDRRIVDDSGGRDLEIAEHAEARKTLKVGDIVVIKKDQHHFMVIDPVKTGFIRGLEGNAGGLKNRMLAANWMANGIHNTVENVYLRYRIIT